LTDQDGGSFGSADLHGKVWIADFIFTRCAGTCPMQSAEKAKLQEELKAHPARDEIRLVTFTVDPEHDTPPVLAEYARAHRADPSHWKFLTGPRGDLWNLSANGFKMDVADDAGNEKMPILHSSRFVLVDRAGRLRGYYDGLEEQGLTDLRA
ncbi:MAG: SCO family protein, partial [Akkermansiaceae bacterium]|nr:SCO family protein [Akkermansiaceae bacterium]